MSNNEEIEYLINETDAIETEFPDLFSKWSNNKESIDFLVFVKKYAHKNLYQIQQLAHKEASKRKI